MVRVVEAVLEFVPKSEGPDMTVLVRLLPRAVLEEWEAPEMEFELEMLG